MIFTPPEDRQQGNAPPHLRMAHDALDVLNLAARQRHQAVVDGQAGLAHDVQPVAQQQVVAARRARQAGRRAMVGAGFMSTTMRRPATQETCNPCALTHAVGAASTQPGLKAGMY